MKIRQEIRNLQTYPVINGKYRIWLDKNENPFDVPPQIKDEFLEEIKKVRFNRYPPITAKPLRERLADLHGVSPDEIVVAQGSSELINNIFHLFKGYYAVVTPPTFSMYFFYAKRAGVPLREVPLNETFEIVGDKLAELASRASVTFIASPNNPTGNLQPEEEILKVLDSGAAVMVDEAYGDFAEKSIFKFFDEYPNLMILRSFSKAFSLAGLRIGYLIAHTKIIEALRRIRPPFAMNILSMIAAMVILRHRTLMDRHIKYIIEERKRMYRMLRDFAYPSQANFLLINLGAFNFLLRRGIVVKNLENLLPSHIRVTVGRRWENDMVLQALKEFHESEEQEMSRR